MKKVILIALIMSCVKSFKTMNLKFKGINEDLVKAIENKDENKVRNLIERVSNINFSYNNKNFLELALDSEKPNLDIIKILIEKGLLPNKENIIKIYDLALDDFDFGLVNIIKDKYNLEEGIIEKNKYFLYLCYTSNAKKVREFIEENNINTREVKDKSGREALTIATLGGKSDILEILEQYEPSVNFKDQIGKASLTEILYSKENIFNINSRDMLGMTPLMYASQEGNLEVFKKLSEKGATIEKYQFGNPNTPLMLASQNGHAEIVKILIEKGADVDEKTTIGRTALMMASEKGHTEVVRILIENSINKDRNKNLALLIATQNGHIRLVEELIKNGANINIKDNYKKKPLMIASEKGYAEIVKTLIKAGANVNDKNEYGSTALMIASEKGHTEVVRKLIEAGVNVNDKNKNDYTALKYASEHGYIDIAKLLIEACADIDYKYKYGQTLLIIASSREHIEIVKVLVEAGANLNEKDHKENTALKIAIQKKNLYLTEQLIKAGADIYGEESNKSALSYISYELKNSREKFERDKLINIAYKLIEKSSKDYIQLFVPFSKNFNISEDEKKRLHNHINLLYHLPTLPQELFEKIVESF